MGYAKRCDNLYESLGDNDTEKIILLEEADGTEEIPTNVVGIILKHDLP